MPHFQTISALLVEAIKELTQTSQYYENTQLFTQTIVAEDNNIQLNFNGSRATALGGGIIVLNAKKEGENAEFVIDSSGDWTTNNNIKAKGLIIPIYTPESSDDNFGIDGSVTRDNNYLYVKDTEGWKRTKLERF